VHGVVPVVDEQVGDVALKGLVDQESHAEAGSGKRGLIDGNGGELERSRTSSAVS